MEPIGFFGLVKFYEKTRKYPKHCVPSRHHKAKGGPIHGFEEEKFRGWPLEPGSGVSSLYQVPLRLMVWVLS